MYLMQDYLAPQADAAIFTDAQWLAALLTFESQLAQAQAECGLIPQSAADAIARACDSVALDRDTFAAQARRSGAVGLALTRPLQQWLATHAPQAQPWLHWGTTTQDAVDTAHAMLTRDALGQLQSALEALCAPLERLARTHAHTPMLARSLLQPAQVTSFGFKCAQALAALRRSRAALRGLTTSALCVQLGGAIGNRAAFGQHGAKLEAALARRLQLHPAGHAWHTQRDGWMRLAMEVAVCSGGLAKLAKDWALLAQCEVGEISEAARGATSSAMPHKRNPVHCMQAVAQTQAVPHIASLLLSCMAQAHERALGEWQAEVAHWASLWQHAIAACQALALAASGLQVHAGRMQANIDALQQVIFSEGLAQALAPFVGAQQASALVAQQSEIALHTSRPLGELLLPYAAQPEARRALADATDLQRAVLASAAACHDLLKE